MNRERKRKKEEVNVRIENGGLERSFYGNIRWSGK